MNLSELQKIYTEAVVKSITPQALHRHLNIHGWHYVASEAHADWMQTNEEDCMIGVPHKDTPMFDQMLLEAVVRLAIYQHKTIEQTLADVNADALSP